MASAMKRIYEFNSGLEDGLRKIKWNALKESSFRFYRGTAHLFAEDFEKKYESNSKVKTWICGDLHFENFGSFKGENRLVYFDLNDFDEAILASPEPELARFLTSVIIAASQMKTPYLTLNKTLNEIIETYVATVLNRKALMMEQEVAHGVFKKYFEQTDTRDRQSFIAKHTEQHKGHLKLKTDNIHLLPIDTALKAKIFDSLQKIKDRYIHFEHMVIVDAAFRIAGTGSLGLQRYCVLCFNKKKGKHYLIDIKESRKSCFSDKVNVKQPKFKNEAERINTVGKIMQFNAPAFLSTLYLDNKWFSVKEMQPTSDKMTLDGFGNDFKTFSEVAMEMAALTAYSHIRSNGHFGASSNDELCKFAEKKQWQKDIIEVSAQLAEKNKKYYTQFLEACK